MIGRILLVAGLMSALGIAADLNAQTPAIGGIVNGATFQAGQPIAPGSLVSIFGTQLAPGTALADSIPLSTQLASVSVSFNGIAAPLDYVSALQINAQIPYEVLPPGTNGTVNVTVTNNGVTSAPQPIVINQFSPGIFPVGNYAAAVIVTDPSDPRYGAFAIPPGTIPGLTTFRAHPNDILTVYATGLGPVDPPVQSGQNSLDALRNTVATPTLLVANTPAQVLFSGLNPQFVAVYQVNMGVPLVAPGDSLPLQIQIGGVTSPPTVAIAVSAQ